MSRRSLRIATTAQLERSVREAGFETFLLPELPSLDFNRPLPDRLSDGAVYRPFLERHDIELVLDFNAAALTLVPSSQPGQVSLTTADLGIPYVACFIDPVTSTMAQMEWKDRWHVLENNTWLKWIWETAHAEELIKLGIPGVLTMPMAAANDDFNTDPLPDPDPGPALAFMGHPASSWFHSQKPIIMPAHLFAGLTAAAVHADMPDLPFHKIFYDLYQFAEPPTMADEFLTRAKKSADYYSQKFVYNAYLAVKQRDRFARFLKLKLGDAFELIGDHWETNYGLKHTPRIWDSKVLHERMRRVPICLNLIKGNVETGLNMRHFEITAQGGFMLTYGTPELSTCFEIGKECAVFHDEAELLEKVHYYLSNPEERREVAAAGQRRTLSSHLYSHRVTRLVELLRSSGALPGAGVAAGTTMSLPKIQVEGMTDEPVPLPAPSA